MITSENGRRIDHFAFCEGCADSCSWGWRPVACVHRQCTGVPIELRRPFPTREEWLTPARLLAPGVIEHGYIVQHGMRAMHLRSIGACMHPECIASIAMDDACFVARRRKDEEYASLCSFPRSTGAHACTRAAAPLAWAERALAALRDGTELPSFHTVRLRTTFCRACRIAANLGHDARHVERGWALRARGVT